MRDADLACDGNEKSSKCGRQNRYAPLKSLFGDTANSLDGINYANKKPQIQYRLCIFLSLWRSSKHVFHRPTHPWQCVCIGRLPCFPCLWHARTDWLCLFIICESLWMISTLLRHGLGNIVPLRSNDIVRTHANAPCARRDYLCICARFVRYLFDRLLSVLASS